MARALRLCLIKEGKVRNRSSWYKLVNKMTDIIYQGILPENRDKKGKRFD